MASSIMVINVLAREYAEDCRIKGSISVPLDGLAAFVENMPRDTEIVVYCAKYACPLSRQAWRLLKNKGFTNIKAYEGGMQEWKQKGLPVEGACEMPYLNEKIQEGASEKDVETISAEELVELLPS